MKRRNAKRQKFNPCERNLGLNLASNLPNTEETCEDTYDEFGRSEFETLVTKSWYVDKTLLIKNIIEDTNNKILITAPSGFGKTTNLSMLKKFLEKTTTTENGPQIKLEMDDNMEEMNREQNSPNFKYFTTKNLKIYLDKKFFFNYFGTFPVMHVDFKSVRGNNYQEVLLKLKEVLHQTFKEHSYLLNSNKLLNKSKDDFKRYANVEIYKYLTNSEVEYGLKYLSECLYRHFNKTDVFILIDEYDTPITAALSNINISEKDLNSIILLIRDMYDALLSNIFIRKAVLTGCHNFAENLLPKNVAHYPFLQSEQFCYYYGLTNEEVKKLLHDKNISEKFNEIKDWYSGYSMKLDYGLRVDLFNTGSVFKYLREGKLGKYCSAHVLNKLDALLTHYKIRENIKFHHLLAWNVVNIKYAEMLSITEIESLKRIIKPSHNATSINEKRVDLFLQFLYEDGCLNLDLKKTWDTLSGSTSYLQLKIPNNEVYYEFCKSLFSLNFFITYYNIHPDDIKIFIDSLKYLQQNKTENKSFIQLAQSIKHLYSNTNLLPRNEFEFQATLYYLIKNSFPHVIKTEAFSMPKEKCFNKCDLAVIIKDSIGIRTGLVFELKLFEGKNSVNALNQIIEKDYYKILNEEITEDNIYLGLHMDKSKEVTITYLVNNICKKRAVTVCSNFIHL